MAIYMDGRIKGHRPIPTFERLDAMVDILGSTKATLFPLLESRAGTGFDALRAWKSGRFLNPRDEAGGATLHSEFSPYYHVGGVYSYYLAAGGNQNLGGEDSTDFEFASNAAFSVGIWIWPIDITTVTLLSKYDVNVQREWRLQLDGSSKIELESFDETNNQDRTGASDTAVTADQWSSIVVTTNGDDSDASMNFYLNGAADGSGNTESGAAYASQPATSAAMIVGATLNTTPALTNLFTGRVALPFVTGKELTANDVASLHAIGQELLGLA